MADVELHSAGLVFAMSADQIVESVLPAADGDDFGAFLNEAVGHGSAYAGRCTNHENVLVLERHVLEVFFVLDWMHVVRGNVEFDDGLG